MNTYPHSKFKTTLEIVEKIENWWTALDLRIRKSYKRPELLRFRNGVNIVCRGGTRDWDVVHELFFAGGYGRAMGYLADLQAPASILDLGGNIGLFSLLAARTKPEATIYAFEPGPPNYALFEANRLLNPNFSDRIILAKEAVAGETEICEWHFDEANPGASGLYTSTGSTFPVQVRSFEEVVSGISGRIHLAKN